MPSRRFIYESAQKPPATIPFVPATVLVTAFDSPALPPRSARTRQRDDIVAPVFVPVTAATPAITAWWTQETKPGYEIQSLHTDQDGPVGILSAVFPDSYWQGERRMPSRFRTSAGESFAPIFVPTAPTVPALTTWWMQETRSAWRNVRNVQFVHFGPVFTPVASAIVFPSNYIQETAPRARRRSALIDLLGLGWLNIQAPVSVFVHPSQIRMLVTQTAGFLFSPAHGIAVQIKASSTIAKIALPAITFKSFSISCTSSYTFKVVV